MPRIGDLPIKRISLKKIVIPHAELPIGLQTSMTEDGMLQNVILRKLFTGRYEVVFGKRRVRCAFENKEKSVDAKVIEGEIDNLTMARIVLTENFQRSPNAGVEAEMLKILQDNGMNQEEMAEFLSVSQPQISKRLRLLKLIPKLFSRLKSGNLSPSAARELAKLPKEQQKEFIDEPKTTLKMISKRKREHSLSELDFVELEKTGCDLCGPLLEEVPEPLKEMNTPGVSCKKHIYKQCIIRVQRDGKDKRVKIPYEACENCFHIRPTMGEA